LTPSLVIGFGFGDGRRLKEVGPNASWHLPTTIQSLCTSDKTAAAAAAAAVAAAAMDAAVAIKPTDYKRVREQYFTTLSLFVGERTGQAGRRQSPGAGYPAHVAIVTKLCPSPGAPAECQMHRPSRPLDNPTLLCTRDGGNGDRQRSGQYPAGG